MKIKIGSRESKLAVIQSRMVMDAIARTVPEAELELVTMKTTGDRILDKTLDQIGGKGLFVKELDQALRDGRADFTVHSLKDMPMEVPEDLPLAAFSKRADPRDALALPEGVTELDPSKPIGCSSRRRQLQLKALFPQMDVKPVRGNVQTRLKKLQDGEFSALVLAAAGLKRLGLEDRISRYFSPEEMLPAAGQGILAVQTRQGVDTACLAGVHDPDAACCALAERAFVRALDGGCSSPVAAYAVVEGETLTLTGLYVSPDETVVRKDSLSGPRTAAETLGETLADKLKKGT
ncbi:hydroxymethylbilane synthase [Oscillibacter valericigenes]|uniref:hydroxymethylbilane synthase n=1 Tax=Oscillibacter valericigenes TaxID=351091 RepID=UPI001EFFF34A|nr:hydroxymethylbilane synthase [Oscillibacter valericigenes]MCF2663300.1 hydroxymethylbilane synthase [Oscillibacter valericigenes]